MVGKEGASVRAHRGLARGARDAEEEGEGDRRAYGQQGAREKRRGEDGVEELDTGHLVGPPRGPSLGHEPPEGTHEGAALQRGETDGDRGPFADVEGAAPARGRPPRLDTHNQVPAGYRREHEPLEARSRRLLGRRP